MSVANCAQQDESTSLYLQFRDLAETVHQQFLSQLKSIGFDSGEVRLQHPDLASYQVDADVATRETVLTGVWRNPRGEKTGALTFYMDGKFFIEQDVIKRHPFRNDYFIEAINAWGNPEQIKCEARILTVGQ